VPRPLLAMAETFAAMQGTFRAWSLATVRVACRRLQTILTSVCMRAYHTGV